MLARMLMALVATAMVSMELFPHAMWPQGVIVLGAVAAAPLVWWALKQAKAAASRTD